MPDQQQSVEESISIKDFLEKTPPGRRVSMKKIAVKQDNSSARNLIYDLPVLELHCETDTCKGFRFFEAWGEASVGQAGSVRAHFVNYRCRNCKECVKTYALWFVIENDMSGWILKLGEEPPFGPPVPARVITLIGGERDYFLKGWRAENQGLGIGAFAYYRRVVENQKNRILDEIIRVAEKLGAPAEMFEDLNAAKKEFQFSTAVSAISSTAFRKRSW